ncbi:MAG TPA: endolytic transglycosylase MltG [Stellaceae bacterium]|nr:endolytic transglycosylase MltG [Stellaceae bacterium]
MRRLGAGFIVALVALCAGVATWMWHSYDAPGPLAAPATVVIPKSARLAAIAEELAAAGVVAHPWVFAAGSYVTGAARNLKAGEYEFAAATSPRAAAALIASGRVVQHRLTLAEGLTSAEAVALIDAAPALDGALETTPPEGSLLPDTYFYVLGTKRWELIARMEHARDRALAEAWQRRAADLPYASPRDALVIASIIEKETAVPAERARIAGVFIQRLRLGMRLQADPTVIYALTDGGRTPLPHPLGHDDLETESPYNTYLEKGLPPTPIDNPGLASIEAALAPEESGDLYFVADGAGHHVFAKTLDEQNHHVAELRRLQHGESGAE